MEDRQIERVQRRRGESRLRTELFKRMYNLKLTWYTWHRTPLREKEDAEERWMPGDARGSQLRKTTNGK